MLWPRGQPPPNPSPHKNTLAVSGTWIGDWSWKRKKWRQQLRLSAARRATWPDGLQVPWETACDEWEQAWPCSGSSAGIFCSFPGRRPRRACVYIAAATLSGNSLRQTVHTHRACDHQAAKLVAAFLRVRRVIAGLAESNGSLPPGLWLTSPAGWLPRTGRISSGSPRSVIECGLPLPF